MSGVVGYGIDTSYPQIDDDGTIHVDQYFSVDRDLENIYFLGQRYKSDRTTDADD